MSIPMLHQHPLIPADTEGLPQKSATQLPPDLQTPASELPQALKELIISLVVGYAEEQQSTPISTNWEDIVCMQLHDEYSFQEDVTYVVAEVIIKDSWDVRWNHTFTVE